MYTCISSFRPPSCSDSHPLPPRPCPRNYTPLQPTGRKHGQCCTALLRRYMYGGPGVHSCVVAVSRVRTQPCSAATCACPAILTVQSQCGMWKRLFCARWKLQRPRQNKLDWFTDTGQNDCTKICAGDIGTYLADPIDLAATARVYFVPSDANVARSVLPRANEVAELFYIRCAGVARGAFYGDVGCTAEQRLRWLLGCGAYVTANDPWASSGGEGAALLTATPVLPAATAAALVSCPNCMKIRPSLRNPVAPACSTSRRADIGDAMMEVGCRASLGVETGRIPDCCVRGTDERMQHRSLPHIYYKY